MARFLFSICLLVLVAGSARSQDFPIYVEWMDQGPDDVHRALNEELGETLRNELALRGHAHEPGGMRLFFRAETLDTSDGELVLVSIVQGFGLREPVLDAGAEHQIWYAGQSEPEDPEEARFVREHMTREVLANLVQVTEIEHLTFAREELAGAVSTWLDAFFERIRCQRPDLECS